VVGAELEATITKGEEIKTSWRAIAWLISMGYQTNRCPDELIECYNTLDVILNVEKNIACCGWNPLKRNVDFQWLCLDLVEFCRGRRVGCKGQSN
jgi:hypothetical protein